MIRLVWDLISPIFKLGLPTLMVTILTGGVTTGGAYYAGKWVGVAEGVQKEAQRWEAATATALKGALAFERDYHREATELMRTVATENAAAVLRLEESKRDLKVETDEEIKRGRAIADKIALDNEELQRIIDNGECGYIGSAEWLRWYDDAIHSAENRSRTLQHPGDL